MVLSRKPLLVFSFSVNCSEILISLSFCSYFDITLKGHPHPQIKAASFFFNMQKLGGKKTLSS